MTSLSLICSSMRMREIRRECVHVCVFTFTLIDVSCSTALIDHLMHHLHCTKQAAG